MYLATVPLLVVSTHVATSGLLINSAAPPKEASAGNSYNVNHWEVALTIEQVRLYRYKPNIIYLLYTLIESHIQVLSILLSLRVLHT